MPLSPDDFILTHMVTDGVVDTEPVAIAIRMIVRASPCGDDPRWSDLEIDKGGVIEEVTIATPFGHLIPTSQAPGG